MKRRLERVPMEPAIVEETIELYCRAISPGGWHCCLPDGHDDNHIGMTQSFGSLYQWPQAEK